MIGSSRPALPWLVCLGCAVGAPARLRLAMESSGSKQRRLPFGRKEYASVWSSVPERDRKELIRVWARLIAAAARVGRPAKGANR